MSMLTWKLGFIELSLKIMFSECKCKYIVI